MVSAVPGSAGGAEGLDMAVRVPDAAHEAMRDLVRSRGDAMEHLKSCKQQLQSFLLGHGRIFNGLRTWTRAHYIWLADQKFEHPAHQIVFQDYINAIHDAGNRHKRLVKQIEDLLPHWSMKPLVEALCLLKGINLIAAVTLLSVTGDLRRFRKPTQLSAYFGLVPSEHSSGPARVANGKERQFSAAEKNLRAIAWRAQIRLCSRYRRLIALGERAPVVCAAVARELTTFIWEMGQIVPITN